MEKELSLKLDTLGIKEKKAVLAKALEYLRLMDHKFPSGLPGMGEICKGMCCIELACKTLKVLNFQKEAALKLSGVSQKDYSQILMLIQNRLNLKFDITLSEICIKFGCAGITSFVQSVLDDFKPKYLESLKDQKKNVDFTRPIYIAAALTVSAHYAKYKIDQKKIVVEFGVNETEYRGICARIDELCQKILNDNGTTVEMKQKVKKAPMTPKVDKKKEKDVVESDLLEFYENLGVDPPKALERGEILPGTVESQKSQDPTKRSLENSEEKPSKKSKSDSNDSPKDSTSVETPKKTQPKKLRQVTLNFFK